MEAHLSKYGKVVTMGTEHLTAGTKLLTITISASFIIM